MEGTSPQQTSPIGFAVHEALEPMITPTRAPGPVLGSAAEREQLGESYRSRRSCGSSIILRRMLPFAAEVTLLAILTNSH
jgi:hypothetical protein